MKIVEYSTCSEKDKYFKQIAAYEWKAVKFLATLLKDNRLQDALGSWGELYLLVDGDVLVSFVTLSAQDCIADSKFMPWLGFFHTAPEYRGNHYGKLLIDGVCEFARNDNYDKIYIATDQIGLYEKYGFRNIENRIDIWGVDSRIYVKEI